MRDLLIFGIVFGALLFIPKRPALGALLFAWISLMNPHRLAYGAAFDFPFAALVGAVTIVSLFIGGQPKRLPMTGVTILLILFLAWTSFTTLFALEPVLAWKEWNRVSKTLFMTLVTILALNTEKDLKAFAWVVGLSLAFYGLKGGAFTLMSGGQNRVFGPSGSYIEDNNALALALLTTVPLIWYLRLQATNKWLRIGLTGLTILTLTAVVGSYSRGALLGGVAMLFFLWLKSRHKMRAAFVLLLFVPFVFAFMPEKWFSRMESIESFHEDGSALGRINAWHFATNVAIAHPLGGGYDVFTHGMFFIYAPNPLDHHDAHSIYFQVLGEHGFIGLAVFVAMMLLSWRTGGRIARLCENKANLKWASDMARMCQVSMAGYGVAGAFLSLAYYDLYYYIITMLVVLEKLLVEWQIKAPYKNFRRYVVPSGAYDQESRS